MNGEMGDAVGVMAHRLFILFHIFVLLMVGGTVCVGFTRDNYNTDSLINFRRVNVPIS